MNINISAICNQPQRLGDEQYYVVPIQGIDDDHDRSDGAYDPETQGEERFVSALREIPLIEIAEIQEQLANNTYQEKDISKIEGNFLVVKR